MTIEEQMKALIIQNFKSVRAFTQSINIPYSTIDSMLKKGIAGTGVQTVLKVCNSLNIDVESIQAGILRQKKSPTSEKTGVEDLTKPESMLLHNFRALNEDGQDRLLETSDDMVTSGKYTKNNSIEIPNEA